MLTQLKQSSKLRLWKPTLMSKLHPQLQPLTPPFFSLFFCTWRWESQTTLTAVICQGKEERKRYGAFVDAIAKGKWLFYSMFHLSTSLNINILTFCILPIFSLKRFFFLFYLLWSSIPKLYLCAEWLLKKKHKKENTPII